LLEFIHVEKKFQEDFWAKPICALDNLSFLVEEGSMCGFLGANGAGKTTAIKTMLQFIKPSAGKVKFSRELGTSWNSIKSQIGYFPERPFFYPTMTGREFCLYLGKLSGLKAGEAKLNLDFWSKKININYALDKKIKNYSKGMLQRLGFTASVIHNPKFVVLDEPLSGLDPIGRREFKDAFVDLHRRGVTVFFSSHIVSDVEEVCNRLVVIEKGKTIFCGSTKDLIEQKSDNYIHVTLGKNESIKNCLNLDVFFESSDIIKARFDKKNQADILAYITKNEIEVLELYCAKPSLEEIVYDKVVP
jgi:ABC-2 type transport system ATP-binding protein